MPARTVLEDGEITIEVVPPGVTCRIAVALFVPRWALTVWSPETVAVQTFAVHEPFGVIEDDVVPNVMSPRELP